MSDCAFPPTEVRTARLLLRKPATADAQAIFDAYASDPDVTRFLTWEPHRNSNETAAFLDGCLAKWADGSGFPFIIEERTTPGAPIGMINLRPSDHRISVGYVLARSSWGRGIAPEALAALVDLSLAQDHIFRFEAFCDAENKASARVMEKVGLTYEGTLRRHSVAPNLSSEPRDCLLFAKVTWRTEPAL